MNRPEPRLTHALALALTVGLSLTGCDPSTPSGSVDPDTDSDSEGTTTALIGTTPADLATVCAAGSWLEHVVLAEPVDYLALRRVESYGGPDGQSGEDVVTVGTPCATASDPAACSAELATTWPESSGWGYCGEGCSDSGLVTTRGDTVSLYDSTAEVAALFGEIDNPADALFLAVTQEYGPECNTVVQTDGGAWRMRATIMISDCEWVDEVREIEIARDGTTTVLQTVEVIESGACAGRLPDGVCDVDGLSGDAVAQHLAHLAWLEAAAVIAFERLALDLSEHNAPQALIDRALAAAVDEVDHAERMGAAARSYGGTVPAVEVAPRQERCLFDIALENATEGCVRETFGVVDALYRAQQAPTEALRALFARIAEDESRHAQLSWDIAAWAEAQLTADERAEIAAAREQAHARLVGALSTERPDTVAMQLGAPTPNVAVAMARTLQRELAAA